MPASDVSIERSERLHYLLEEGIDDGRAQGRDEDDRDQARAELNAGSK